MRSTCSSVRLVAVAIAVAAAGGLAARPARGGADEPWPDDRLERFMDELIAYVDAHHVVRDANAVTYGMNYEFCDPRTGRKIQDFGLDTMHDGAWFANGLLAAHRARPEGGYLRRLLRYELPFYVNLLNRSDVLFPEKVERQDKKEIVEPLTGWAPRGWDEGIGFDFTSGERFGEITWDPRKAEQVVTRRKDGEFWYCYYTPSNHLSQDLADLMLNAWLSTRSPRVAAAARNVRNYKLEYFGPIIVLEHAAATIADVKPKRGFPAPRLDAADTGAYHAGLYLQRDARLPTHSDKLAWVYQGRVAEAVKQGRPLDAVAAWEIAAEIHGAMATYEAWYGEAAWPVGLYLFHRAPMAMRDGGFPAAYDPDKPPLAGTRGIQLSWIAAGVLPALRRSPEAWETPYRKRHAEDALVPIVDAAEAPEIDGRADKDFPAEPVIHADATAVRALADPAALTLLVSGSKAKVTLRIAAAVEGDAGGLAGVVTIRDDGSVAAVNSEGEKLTCESAFVAGKTWTAELRLPYTFVPGQRRWINGVDHGRYTVCLQAGKPAGLYLLSKPQRIIARMERLALGTVRTWHAVWKGKGYLPAAWRPRGRTPGNWDLSENGGYAHLVHTIALLLIDRAGTAEWTRAAAQAPETPIPVRLPPTVLKAQGAR